ncbi:transcription factor, MADS-box [Artemisia annua]|uniref:Transcription factor, MADS-box n=1 Tax=Artemisia annua TaxID=35608 RepID=A0A2U1NLT5_ARTAN|nr:transcription factor, MADS-box [Artemisia annua]
MTRPAVKYQFLLNEQKRKATLRKRKASLIKKMNELKILCDVDACLVMYDTPEAPVEVWPSHSEAMRIIEKFDEARMVSPYPELDRKAFIQKSISKAEKQLKRQKEKNAKLLMEICLNDINAVNGLNPEELHSLCGALDNQLKLIDEAINAKTFTVKGKEQMS